MAAGEQENEWPVEPGVVLAELPLPAEAENEPLYLTHARAACSDRDWENRGVSDWNDMLLEELSKNNPFGKSAMYAGDQAFAAFLQGVGVWRAALALAVADLEERERAVHPCGAFALAGDEVLAYIGL